ncbi:MAG: hypothetical protein OEQ39_02550 [Gammaproteobacteria bacterium]|nr:hypothetical protein [Gammaproteobacteria bacterium]MDH3466849.1 hypothetical protein [Gammaproteobacteria bacterium]
MAPANRILAFIALGLIFACAVYLLGGVKWLPWDLRPGSPIGQSLGICAGMVLLGTLYYVRVRRSENTRLAKPASQTWHSLVSTLGATLAILHSQAALREWSTLVLLAIIGLLATGLYGRVIAPLRVGAAFGRSAVPYAVMEQPNATSNAVSDLIYAKRMLLKSLTDDTREGEFVLRWHHWTERPRAALRYHRLTLAERRLLARNPLSASAEIPAMERLWRRLHLLLAAMFIVGLLAHVVTTVFFAGYVADGREIYWWHITKW